jgi:hypothetical protein
MAFKIEEKSDAQVQKAFDAAVAKGDIANAMSFKEELDRRATPKAGTTDMLQQGLGGFYEGLASGFGAPVDLVSYGLRSAGLPVGDKPFGGTESLKGLLQGVSGGTAIPDTGPQTASQRIVRGTTEALGTAIPTTLGLIASAPKAVATGAPTAWNAFKNVIAEVRGQAAKSPAAFAASEGTMSASSGASGAAVEEIFPENPTAKMIAELLGAGTGAVGVRTAERIGDASVATVNSILNKTPKGALSADDLKNTAGKLYDDQIESGLSAQPDVTAPMFDNIFKRLDMQGIILPDGKVDPEYGKINNIVQILEQYAKKGMTGAQILRMRQIITGRMDDAEGSQKNAIRNILREFDASTAELSPTIKTANALYSRAMKANQMEEMTALAKSRAASQNGDFENALRTEFRMLHRRIIKGQEAGWTEVEKQEIGRIVEGGPIENMLRFVGKLSPKGVVSISGGMGLPFMAAMQVTGDPIVSGTVAASVAGTGLAANRAAGAVQMSNVDRLMQSMLQGRNLSKPAEDRLRAAATAYLAGQAATEAPKVPLRIELNTPMGGN